MSRKRQPTVINFGNALTVCYLPVNQAWLVLWHDQRLWGPGSKSDAIDYAKSLLGNDKRNL